MNFIKTLFVISLLTVSSLVNAASWYQVEVIVFERIYPYLDGERWEQTDYLPRDNMVELQGNDPAQNSQRLIPYMVIDNQNRMGGINSVLRNSGEYRPLLHLSWQQPPTERQSSRFVHLQRLNSNPDTTASDDTIDSNQIRDWLFNGGIRIRSGFYLHADVDLTYFKQLAPENRVIRTKEELALNTSMLTPITLKETRKIKLNEIHYFDHPMFGVIMQVSRL